MAWCVFVIVAMIASGSETPSARHTRPSMAKEGESVGEVAAVGMGRLPVGTGVVVACSGMLFGTSAKAFHATRHPVAAVLALGGLVAGLTAIYSSIDFDAAQAPTPR